MADLHLSLVFENASIMAAVKIRTLFPVLVYKSRIYSPVYWLFCILVQNLLLDKWIVVCFVSTTNFHWCLGGIPLLLLGSQIGELNSQIDQLQPFQSLCSVKMSFMLPPKSCYLLHLHAFVWRVRAAKLDGKLHVSFAQQGDDRGERIDFHNLFLYLILHGDLSLSSL